ncbi:DNA alkylation repair protein [Cytophagaceae bacterium ABcell3]|nr:DNA alkylation repair protein [Cytophagaceae bacterium ABcell3]
MSVEDSIIKSLASHADATKAAFLPQFFKALPGGYGEGDAFIGVSVPNQRKTAKQFYKQADLNDVSALLQHPVHEHRLTALFILVLKYEKAKGESEKQEIVDTYLRNLHAVNNWDLVDSSADKILGSYLYDRDRELLYDLVNSGELWKQRIAIISTFYFIKKKDFSDTLKLAEILLSHEHDLIHKAVGWMLREIGNRNFDVEYEFLAKFYRQMPRTMLRYAIEKFEEDLRQKFLKGKI